MIEFVLVFPILFLLLFGGIEVNRLMLIQQKLEKAGYVMADITTQYQPATNPLTAGQISVTEMNNNVFPQLARMMGSYSSPQNQVAIITAIRILPAADKQIDWQIVGGGNLADICDSEVPQTCVRSIVNGRAPSEISEAVRGTIATFPNNAEVGAIVDQLPQQYGVTGYSLLVNEVFYFYQPLLQALLQDVGSASGGDSAGFRFFLQPKIYVKRTYFVPRQESKLFDLPPTFPVL